MRAANAKPSSLKAAALGSQRPGPSDSRQGNSSSDFYKTISMVLIFTSEGKREESSTVKGLTLRSEGSAPHLSESAVLTPLGKSGAFFKNRIKLHQWHFGKQRLFRGKEIWVLIFTECSSTECLRATGRKSTIEPQRNEEKETKRRPADQNHCHPCWDVSSQRCLVDWSGI